MRAWLLVVAVAGCEPGFPLPTVQGPSLTWSPRAPPAPGPCLQTTHTRKHRWLWKRGVEQPGSFDRALVAATDDDARAHALAVRALDEDRAAMGLGLGGAGVWAAAVLGAVIDDHHDALWLGPGGATYAVGVALALGLSVASERASRAAIDAYNANCRP